MKSSIVEVAKKRLIEAAEKEYGEISPCGEDPFTEDGDMLFFWFNCPDNSTRTKHIHLIHEKLA